MCPSTQRKAEGRVVTQIIRQASPVGKREDFFPGIHCLEGWDTLEHMWDF